MSSKSTFSFYLNKFKKEKNNQLPIYMRLTNSRKKKELDTGYYAGVNEWLTGKGRTKQNANTNDALNNFESRFYLKMTEFFKTGSPVNLDELKDFITNTHINSTPSLNSYLEEYCEKTKSRTDIVQATKSRYERCKETVLGFLN